MTTPVSDAPSATATTSLSSRLKAESQDLHTLAERHPIQAALVSGRASRADYSAYLAQMFWAHDAFEESLRTAVERDATVKGFVLEHHYRLAQVSDDLTFLGVDARSTAPSGGATRFGAWTGHLARTRPTSLLGVLYVLEGSTNGGRYIARALRRSLDLPETRGTAYFDPHGEHQTPRWTAFKTSLDSLALDEPSQLEAIAAARATFSSIIDIMSGMPAPAAA